jgi:multiple sugar transport system permease protein
MSAVMLRYRGRARTRLLRHPGQLLARTLLYAVLLVLSVAFALPLVWMVSTSLKTGPQAFVVPPQFVPRPVVWQNYINGLTYMPFGRYTVNTLTIIVLRLVGSLGVCSVIAYGFSRIEWDGRDTVFLICIATMIIPGAVTMIPVYLLFNAFGWLGTYLPLFVPDLLGDPYYIFLLRQFFMGIPQELSDAARVDGCNEAQIYWRIILPLSKPVLAVVGLLQFMFSWGEYMRPLIYITQDEKYTVALGLFRFGSSWRGATLDRYAWFMAVTSAMTLPVLFIFFFVQRSFIEGISLTGLKG